MEKIYLGISLGFNSSAAILSSERGLIAAISQERLNGIKNTKELPIDAVFECARIAQIKRVDEICISHYEIIRNEYFKRYTPEKYKEIFNQMDWDKGLIHILSKTLEIKNETITRVPHHTAHAFSTFAFYKSPKIGDYIITSDGFGDGYSGRIFRFMQDCVSEVKLKNSIALVYQFVTGALGFKEHQHEGKITGLAAYGKPVFINDFENLYTSSNDGNFLDFNDELYHLDANETESVINSAIVDFDMFLKLKKSIYGLVNNLIENGAKQEDIASSVQEFAETKTIDWITYNCKKGHNCYLAGGLFANVKINQRVKETGLFNNVFVCPAMGDEGTAVGSALYCAWENEEFDDNEVITLPTTCAGNSIDGNIYEFVKNNVDLNEYNITLLLDNHVERTIAEKLSQDKIVCVVKGRMEFGPRALCHRSIMYNCDTKETNDWLNKKLSRTEFMPFAPVCCEEFADDLFLDLDGGRDSAKLMTMTFNCTDEFKDNYPAACHIDCTARPQIVNKNEDIFTWNILNEYYKLTNKKALINTSFNLHNWPIIATKEVALDSWLKSDTDCLLIENVLIEKIGGRDE